MKTRFRRAISKTRRSISLVLVTDQCQHRVGSQYYIRTKVLRSNLFSREILPTDENLRAAFFRVRDRFQVWIARAKPRHATGPGMPSTAAPWNSTANLAFANGTRPAPG